MSCKHNNEVDSCDDCVTEAQRRGTTAGEIQRAAESRRIRGGNKPPEEKPKPEAKHRKK